MSDIRIHIDGDLDPKHNETYIGSINIDRPPFHLVTISNLKQFSWEVGRSRIGEPLETLVRHLKKNQTRCLFLKISENQTLFDAVENAYKNSYDAETCIGPINAFLNESCLNMDRQPLTVFELMDVLKANSIWNGSFGLNLNSDEIKLAKYDRKTVDRYVKGLKTLEPQRS